MTVLFSPNHCLLLCFNFLRIPETTCSTALWTSDLCCSPSFSASCFCSTFLLVVGFISPFQGGTSCELLFFRCNNHFSFSLHLTLALAAVQTVLRAPYSWLPLSWRSPVSVVLVVLQLSFWHLIYVSHLSTLLPRFATTSIHYCWQKICLFQIF